MKVCLKKNQGGLNRKVAQGESARLYQRSQSSERPTGTEKEDRDGLFPQAPTSFALATSTVVWLSWVRKTSESAE